MAPGPQGAREERWAAKGLPSRNIPALFQRVTDHGRAPHGAGDCPGGLRP